MVITVWEVYAEVNERSLIFRNKSSALEQCIINRVDRVCQSEVDLSREEIEALLAGNYIWG